MLSAAPYEGCTFPLVRKIIFGLTYEFGDPYDSEPESDDADDDDNNDLESESDGSNASMEQHIYPRDVTANITAFAQRIKKMAPTVSEIDVATNEDVDGLFMDNNRHIFQLAEELFGIVEKHTVFTDGRAHLVMLLKPETIRDLVHIDYMMERNTSDVTLLMRRSAQTLQFLDIYVYDADASDIFSDPDGGGYLEFPSMHTLKIGAISNIEPSKKAVFKEIVPFPRLRRLSAISDYPFGDDVVFRGNAVTLEFLELELAPKMVAMLREYKVFSPTSHPNLKCVIFRPRACSLPSAFSTVTDYTQFVLSIAPEAPMRVIPGFFKLPEVPMPALSMLGDHDCIQTLSLPDTSLSLMEAIELIKSLPLLSDLHTWELAIGEFPQGISTAMLPGYVRATYSPIGKRFRCWHVNIEGAREKTYVEIATCMLLIALACPNFDYAAVKRKYREFFMMAMEEKINEPEFSQDAPRLRRLLFNVC
ncbi:hypothetical protein FBU31_001620 [Coemansia sp. 'formosensis']|nr:hypothetical protein FBU31_001620 [Coemansia sp. 'formosensis']